MCDLGEVLVKYSTRVPGVGEIGGSGNWWRQGSHLEKERRDIIGMS